MTEAPLPGQPQRRARRIAARLGALAGDAPPELVLLCLVAIVASFVVMLPNLGSKPFWVDESIAVLPARSILSTGLPRSPFDLNYMAFQLEDGLWDPSAPLYRYSVAAVAALVGFSEVTTRGFSVLLGLLLLLPCHALFRRRYGAAVAWLAVALLASAPAFADEAREARHFTFVALGMAATLYFLSRAADPATPDAAARRARTLWPLVLTASLLGHAVAYLVLPLVVALLIETGPSRVFSRRQLPVYIGCGAVYLAIQARYGHTLPFLHAIDCRNRVAGCEPDPLFYAGTLVTFLGLDGPLVDAARSPGVATILSAAMAALPFALLVAGLAATVAGARRDEDGRAQHLLFLAWFAFPLVLLSTRELKFARYLFYVLPPMMLLVARGAVALSSAGPPGRARRPLLFATAALVLLGPRLEDGWRLRSRLVANASKLLDDQETDSWERTRTQAVLLRERMKPEDVVVTSFDDAGLGYYLGRFVYGFLNSSHDDAFFLDLLEQASRRGSRVFFIDTLPTQNHCQTPGDAPLNIDCRAKYRRFYAACRNDNPKRHPSCVRIAFP